MQATLEGRMQRRTSPSTNSRGRPSPTVNSRTRSPVVGGAANNQQRDGTGAAQQSTPTHYQQVLASSLKIKNFQNISRQQQQQHPSSAAPASASASASASAGGSSRHHPGATTPIGGGGGGAPSHLLGRSPRVAAGSTPNSARSLSCITDLEGVIDQVMKERMHSLTESRKRVEDLADYQRKETDTFLRAMEQVIAQSNLASSAQVEMQEDYEARLERERGEKSRMLSILQRFKQEGDRVTQDLKRALGDERERHKEASYRNEQLLGKVRELQDRLKTQHHQIQQLQQVQQQYRSQQAALQQGGGGGGNSLLLDAGGEGRSSSQQSQQQHVTQLVSLLKEHEHVIDELERRNRNLEHDLRYQKSMMAAGGGGGGGSKEWGTSGEIKIPDGLQLAEGSTTPQQQQQLNGLMQQFAASSEGQNMAPDQLALLVRGLMAQLKNENRMRLRVEEQSTKLVADQDEQIRKLESKLRDIEMGGGGSGGGGVKVGSPSPARPGVAAAAATREQQQRHQQSTTNLNKTGEPRRLPGANTNTNTNAPLAGAPKLPALSGTSGTATPPPEPAQGGGARSASSSSSIPPAGPPPASSYLHQQQQEPKQQAVIGLEDDDAAMMDDEFQPVEPNNKKGGGASYSATSSKAPSVSVTEIKPGQNNNNNNSTSQRREGSAASAAGLPSLEDQLATVTNEFNDAVESWETAAGAKKPQSKNNKDSEFEPAPRPTLAAPQ